MKIKACTLSKLFFVIIIFLTCNNYLFALMQIKAPAISVGNSLYLNGNGLGTSPELNVNMFLFSAGTSVQYQYEIKPIYNVYLGIGLANILQIQYGYSGDNKLRVKTEYPVFSNSDPMWDPVLDGWEDRLSLLINIEANFNNMKYTHLGVGFTYVVN